MAGPFAVIPCALRPEMTLRRHGITPDRSKIADKREGAFRDDGWVSYLILNLFFTASRMRK
jgi:hypothetical protein